jgi:hypothetical protein
MKPRLNALRLAFSLGPVQSSSPGFPEILQSVGLAVAMANEVDDILFSYSANSTKVRECLLQAMPTWVEKA